MMIDNTILKLLKEYIKLCKKVDRMVELGTSDMITERTLDKIEQDFIIESGMTIRDFANQFAELIPMDNMAIVIDIKRGELKQTATIHLN